jgi:hypothetical protein
MCLAHNEDFSLTHQLYWYGTIGIAGRGDEGIRKGKRGRLTVLLEAAGLSPGEAVSFADRFAARVPIHRFSSDYFSKGGLPRLAAADLDDARYITEAARRVLRSTVGFEAFADNLRFEIIPVDEGRFTVSTNIDFAAGNARRKADAPELEETKEQNILAAIFAAGVDLALASYYGAEFATTPLNSDLLRLRYADLLRRTDEATAQRGQSEDIVLDGFPRIREVIDSREASFDELLKLLDGSGKKFRKWAHGIPPDTRLVPEYVRQISGESWIAKLPAKSVRYVLGNAIGLAGFVHPVASAVGAAVYSFFDNLLLDRMGGSWRPSHFVEGELKPFLKRQQGG